MPRLTVTLASVPAFAARLLWLLLSVVWLAGIAACERQNPGDGEAAPVVNAEEMRIVTLAPALTQMLVDLEQDRLLVGVAANDDAAPEGTPVVGTAWEVDSEALLKARPTHVLMMVNKEGPPARLLELSRSASFQVVGYPYPTSITAVSRILFDETAATPLPPGMPTAAGSAGAEGAVPPTAPPATTGPQTGSGPPSLGALLGENLRAQVLWWKMLERMSKVGRVTYRGVETPRPRVLLVIGTDPLMASGPGTVNDELLGLFLNAHNAAEESAVTAPTYDREALQKLAPDVILLLLPNAPALEALDRDPRLTIFSGLDIPAVRDGRIALVNDPQVLLPSTSLGRIVPMLGRAIYPDLVDQINQVAGDTSEERGDADLSGKLPVTASGRAPVATAPATAPAASAATQP